MTWPPIAQIIQISENFVIPMFLSLNADTNLKKRCDTEVGRVQIVPVLPQGKHDGANHKVDHHHHHAGSGWYRHLILKILLHFGYLD